MAYFEIDVIGGGNTRLDTAVLLDSDNFTIPREAGGVTGTLDVFVWNASDTPVDVYLLTGNVDLEIVKDPDHYEDAQSESNVRSVTRGRITGDNAFVDIRGLAPGEYYPFRITNPLPNGDRPWLDANSCTMSTSGHGTNIFNGQRVHVFGHHTPD